MAYALPPELQGIPDWQASSARRLKYAMVLAAIFVLSGLSVFRMPVAGDVIPLFELVVRLIESASEPAPETVGPAASKPAAAPTDLAEPAEETPGPAETAEIDPPVQPAPLQQDETEVEQSPGIIPVPLEAAGTPRDSLEIQFVEDWREFGTEIVQEFIANLPKAITVNPVFDEKRRLAAIKFRPSNAPVRHNPWDDVEKDQIGRSILKLGNNCFQVLEDPSAVNREIFETYTQYVVQCTLTFGKRPGQELPWVKEIRAKYPYLLLREQQKRDPKAF